MKKRTMVCLAILKLIILLLSVAALGCHIAQIELLRKEPGTGNWWPKYAPYTLYYVASIVSLVSALFLMAFGCLFKSMLIDRAVSLVNFCLIIAIVVYNSLRSGTIPWTSNSTPLSTSRKGWANYCSSYSNHVISTRCWLTNGTWLCLILVGFVWALFAIYSLTLRQSDISTKDDESYDFKDDLPMADHTERRIVEGGAIVGGAVVGPAFATSRPTSPQESIGRVASPSPFAVPAHHSYRSNTPDDIDYTNMSPYDGFHGLHSMNDSRNSYIPKSVPHTPPAQQESSGEMGHFEQGQRRGSKVYLEEEDNNQYSPATPSVVTRSTDSMNQQPPHSYGEGSSDSKLHSYH